MRQQFYSIPLSLLIMFLITGCASSSWWQAKLMSDADVQQAIDLEESQDPKVCIRARGSGSALGVEGMIEVIKARGKNVSFQDCLNYFNRTVTTIVLPAVTKNE